MKAKEMLGKVNVVARRGMFQVKKYSPEILLATGIVGVLAGTVLACKATLKVENVLDEGKKTIDKIHETRNRNDYQDKYTEKDAKEDLTKTYIRIGWKLTKLYAPAVLTESFSIACILSSNNILKKRNVALSAAFATVSESFSEYRKRVADKFGDEVDKELLYNIKAETIDETVTDPKTGEIKTVQKTVDVADTKNLYTVYFDSETSHYYESAHEDYNDFFLRSEENYATDILRIKGMLTVNDVIDRLNIKITDEQRQAFMVLGWLYRPNNPLGDNRVKFRAQRTHRRLATGEVIPTIILDFNADGNIYKLMGEQNVRKQLQKLEEQNA